MNKRKIIAHVATSADGFIGRPDGNLDWLDRPAPKGHYGMVAFLKSIDTMVWGRKTFDEAASRGGTDPFGSNIKHYVFSHNAPGAAASGVEFVNQPIPEFASRLRTTPGKDIWMMGGAGVIGSFLDAGEIDEFILHVIPVFIGEGIPLIQARRRSQELTLLSIRKFPDGVVRLHYRVTYQAVRVE